MKFVIIGLYIAVRDSVYGPKPDIPTGAMNVHFRGSAQAIAACEGG
jgi:hypothetical protein